MLGSVVNLQPFGDAPRFRRLERLVQRGRVVGVQIVHHQYDPVFVRIVLVHQLLDHPRPIYFGAPVRHFHPAPPFQRSEQHEKVAHPVALVFVIVGPGRPRPRRAGLTGLAYLLLAGLVQAHQHFVVAIGAMIDRQHVFHRAHELGAALGRDAPAFFQPRLEFVFFSVWRTVSGLMLSTISRSTNRSANNFSVQPARPSGGSPQARAIRWASP